ncbi:DUF4150 domain-containing protein [Burkholderia ubonensis]|uniref:DUF4150 domain-containing protein n=1 Tax=Burkholderia ubonensis TaxID=101571 RepID=UPI0007C7E4CA|nr:DUF4150 domain-containing protein [Burkholderia ubonensis]OJA34961.1 hypothetical protein BGX87_07360 [Burkholderia ubonensis]OJA73530.1 hypothetical protein BGV67_06930 [Burkholderia ubonensis]OJA88150.1 hypothetical protein BGV49_06430 [Burkholderia ubonensis]
MADKTIARKASDWRVVSIVPDVCKTPMGGSTPPVPYPVVAELKEAAFPAKATRVNGEPIVLYDASKTPKTYGDEAGVADGVKSGTVGGDCWPIERSATVRVESRYIVRQDDQFWMNGRQAGGSSQPRGWTKECVLKILCPTDKDKVKLLSEIKLTTAKSITFMDREFDGKNWKSKPFPAGGTSDASSGTIGVLDGDSCQGVAGTFFHELTHQQQPESMSWAEAELDAYTKSEQWAISKGFPETFPGFRTKDANGNFVPNAAKINEFVHQEYPVGVQEIISSGPNKGQVRLTDGTVRPPKVGDVVSGARIAKGEHEVDTSDWKCPS